MKSERRRMSVSLLSGVLLTLTYPKLSFSWLAWIALVPLFRVLLTAPSRTAALRYTAAAAGIFFLLSLSWLRYVTLFGWMALVLLETCLVLPLGLAAYECRRFSNPALRAFLLAGAWTFCEILRSEIPVLGLGWNLLAYSQASHVAFVQSGSVFGAFGLSYVIAFVNALLAEAVFGLPRESLSWKLLWKPALAAGSAVLVVVALYSGGLHRLGQQMMAPEHIRISLIQGNIPQSVKWEAMARDEILQIHLKLTELAAFDEPHLMIWPEASFPGYFNRAQDASAVHEMVKRTGVPLLIGAPHYESFHEVYNSAYLLTPEGEAASRYDKNYLVPFGEYVPFGPLLHWLQPMAQSLGVSDFSAGGEPVVFRLPEIDFPFTVLICFEDVFASLARRFAGPEVKFFSVITNDAWFGPTGAPYQHLQASVFRAVENGIPLVRAANTGVSAFVSHTGEVLATLTGDGGRDIFVSGYKTYSLPLIRLSTVYRQGGWLLPYGLSLLSVIILVISSMKAERSGAAQGKVSFKS